MRNIKSKLLILISLLCMASVGWSVITDYTFTTSTGTYTSLTDGTIHGTDTNDEQVFNAVPLGFTFNYNGVEYTTVSISCNGFIAMGPTVTTSNVAISAGASNNVIVALNRNLSSRQGGTLISALSGTAPNRVFTIQWQNYRRQVVATANDTLNFQIKLFETTNRITFNYGFFSAVTSSLNQNMQVGLRGSSNSEFTNRTTTANWAATTAGTVNTAACVLSATVFPANGLIFTWAPPGIGEPPSPAQLVSPLNNAANVSIHTTLNWISGGGAPTGYKVYFGTDTPPTNIVNGTVTTANTYGPIPGLSYNTVYNWRIVPTNNNGDALNCPVWSFTTQPDPTVTVFPYTQNWDSVTAPAVPPSWTVVNANNDNVTWITVNSGAYSSPNAIRCIFNTVAMDDWLISPPLQLVGNSFYRIQFRYKAQNASFPEKMEIKYGTGNSPTALTEQIYVNENIVNTGYLLGEAYMSPTTNGIYYFGFHGYSAANMYWLWLDDITVAEVIPVFNPPQNLTAITGNGSVILNWQTPALNRALRGYYVYRNGVLASTEVVMTTSYIDTTAPIGVSASYYVIASYVSPTGLSEPSNTVTITPLFNPPTNVQAAGGINQVVLTWQAPTEFSPAGYNVLRDGEMINPQLITALTYTDNSVVPGTTYAYSIVATYTNPVGQSAPTPNVNGEALNPPTELSATVSGPSVILNWISPVIARDSRDNVNFTRFLTGFKVYRDAILIHTLTNSTTTTYTDLNLLPGTYSYTLTATYTTGESIPTAPAVGTVSSTFYSPTNLVAVGSVSGILLTWNAPNPLLPNLVGYRVVKNGFPSGHGLITSTTYNDTDVAYGVTYSYYILAIYTNPNGISLPSNTVTASGGEPLLPVYNLQNTVAMDNVGLTWLPPGGPIYQSWLRYDDGYNANALGTNSAANFDVAARFTQTELTGLSNRYVTKVRFFPHEPNCVYTVKVWSGGTSLVNPGTLVSEVPVVNPVIDAWNVVILPQPIQVPSVGELRIGYNCNTQGGYPAGVDDGPSIPYKSNLIYLNNEWTITTLLNPDLDFNWNLQAFITNFLGRESVLTHTPEIIPQEITAPVTNAQLSSVRTYRAEKSFSVNHNDRPMYGYKVYRNGTPVATINDILHYYYNDSAVPNGTHTYTVTALYNGGESPHCEPTIAVVNVPIVPIIYQDSFETYDDFALTFPMWSLLDVDTSPTAGITGYDFANEGSPMSFMVFNPSATTPAMTGLSAHTGQKMLASFAATTPPNNDWLISPLIHLGTESRISLWVKSFTADYGLERFKVGISNAPNPIPLTFAMLSGANYVEAPVDWTKFTYNVPITFAAQNVRFGIKCESDDAFIFLVDDVVIQGINGYVVANDDQVIPSLETALLGSYPNPFRNETNISFNLKADNKVALEIYNLKGQKVRTLVNGKTKSGTHNITWKGDDDKGNPVASGVYYFKMNSGKYTSSKKMILLK